MQIIPASNRNREMDKPKKEPKKLVKKLVICTEPDRVLSKIFSSSKIKF